ncbi:phage terminase large subunit family protein [Pseudomaricurvus alkylphenolicus]|uniref:phage terminase large subunit family protein n=1 Tax=Pseudomaricurvus alkylphenolicus TaxID=1306991 RepID=UPI001423CB4F|nr:terminase gpA endonuclease subunit [Pseudomaricurvus alkylphenolicus]NIB44823.1 phage terminase large subunit family protein [Pseudomaricurvus alkylphenolicus]
MLKLRANLGRILVQASETLVPKSPESTADWSQESLRLPREVGAFQTKFDLDYGPHLYGIFAAFDDPEIPEVYCMKAAQVLWTTALIAYIFNRVCGPGCVILGMFASDSQARKFSQKKLEPMGKATPEVQKLVDFTTSRRSGNSILSKQWEGGWMEFFGSNAAGNMKSTTADFVFVEEPDDANENVGNQGDSIKLLFERTKRARRPKKILGGTPSVKGFSRVAEHIERSDKRVLPVKCHECGEAHPLMFEQLWGWQAPDNPESEKHPIYGFHRPELTVYACPGCGTEWDDFQRKENIRNTVYDAMEAGDPLCGWVPTSNSPGVAGFTGLNELYSCLPGVGMADMVRDYLEAEHYADLGDNTKKIVFINSKLGRAYEYEDTRSDADTLRKEAKADPESQHDELMCPDQGLIITIGIDVQDDRLAVVIRAHGRKRRSWLMYADELYAEKTTINDQDAVWTALDKLVFSPFEHESGGSIFASAITIDSGGHATDAVYEWVSTREKKYPTVEIMAGKGSSSKTDPPVFVTPSKTLTHKDPKKRTKADKKGLKLYIIGTNKAKDYVSDQMALNAKGVGRFHYFNSDQMRDDYFDQLLAESKIPDKSGRKTWKQKPGCPCEFWDCEVYAEHAARAVNVHTKSDKQWDEIELNIKQSDLFSEARPLEVVESELEEAPRRESNYRI